MTTAVLGSCVFGGVYLRGSMGQALRRPEPTSEPTDGRTPRRVEGSWLGPIDCLLELSTPRNLGVPLAGGTVASRDGMAGPQGQGVLSENGRKKYSGRTGQVIVSEARARATSSNLQKSFASLVMQYQSDESC